MTDTHVIETQDNTPIIEKTEKSFNKWVFMAIILLITFSLFYLFKNAFLAGQKTTKEDQKVSVSPIEIQISPTQSINDNVASYKCPETEYVNCMPGQGPVQAECAKEYLTWASKNCPGFNGAAY